MENVNWTQVLVFGLVVLVVLALGVGILFLLLGGSLGTMGGGMMGPGGRGGGWCPWCGTGGIGLGSLGAVLGLALACLLPLGLVALVIVGVVWLARNASSTTPRRSVGTCPACGQPVEPGWQTCPYCGADLLEEPGNE